MPPAGDAPGEVRSTQILNVPYRTAILAHSILTRFQRATTILEDQKRMILAKNSRLFSVELMAKTKKKGLRQKFWPFFGPIDGEDQNRQKFKKIR